MASASLTGTGSLSAIGITSDQALANLSGDGGLIAFGLQDLCVFPYIVHIYGGVFFCVGNIGSWVPSVKSNVRELCIVDC